MARATINDRQPVTDWAGAPIVSSAACSRSTQPATSTFDAHSADVIFQGPIADALRRVGQLAIIRGAAGTPIEPESYARAEVRVGRVGPDRQSMAKEFDGDASRPRRP